MRRERERERGRTTFTNAITGRPVDVRAWLELGVAMTCLGTNLVTVGAMAEAARRARLPCEVCMLLPCEGKHTGIVGPCCVCCPVSPVATVPGDE